MELLGSKRAICGGKDRRLAKFVHGKAGPEMIYHEL